MPRLSGAPPGAPARTSQPSRQALPSLIDADGGADVSIAYEGLPAGVSTADTKSGRAWRSQSRHTHADEETVLPPARVGGIVRRMEFASPVYEAAHHRLRTRFGERVEPWWQGVPEAVAELSDRWDLAVDAPVGHGNTSLVLSCRRADGSCAMLKLSPDAELAVAEAT